MPKTVCMLNLYSVKYMVRWIVICLALGCVPFVAAAQTSSSLQRMTVTTVTLIMDSVNTVSEMELVRTHITGFKEVQDFDIKMKNCNFTMDNSRNTLEQIVEELKAYQQPATIYAIRSNETFTRVPEESCDAQKRSVPNMSEEEVIKRGITRKGGQ